ncbi:MAG: hypothetical protein H0W49_11610 [Nitrospirales bacterium]|nr:hypothetical protein [Nitrospirales bacterium]
MREASNRIRWLNYLNFRQPSTHPRIVESSDGAEAVMLATRVIPDVVVKNNHMPKLRATGLSDGRKNMGKYINLQALEL